jgi:Ca-activated chloride channel homolog
MKGSSPALSAVSLIAALALLICGVSKSEVSAQGSKPSIERVALRLAVLDEDEKLIDKLDHADLKIFEDGVEQEITSFRKLDGPKYVAILVDNSGSMRWIINSVIKAAGTIAINIDDQTEVALIRFVDSSKVEVFSDWTTDRKDILEGVESLYVEGGRTALNDALYLAIENVHGKAGDRGNGAIVLISDGADVSSFYSQKDLRKLLDEKRVPIFTLAFSSHLTDRYDPATRERNVRTRALDLMNNLALVSGGGAYILEKGFSNDDVTAGIRSMMIELKSQFVVEYTPKNQKRDGIKRELRVEIADGPDGAKRSGFVRNSYTVPERGLGN